VLIDLARAPDPRWQAAALAAARPRGGLEGVQLQPFLASPDARVKAAALRLADRIGPPARPQVEAAQGSADAAVRDAALEVGLVMGLKSSYLAARRIVGDREPDLAFPLLVLAISGDPADLEAIGGALAAPGHRAAALRALGVSGWGGAVDLCLPHLEDERVARLAGEAVTAVTGLAIDGVYVEEEPPAPDELLPLEEDDLDADLVPGPEAALPAPDADRVAAWWKKERPRFEPAARYLAGRPWDRDGMLEQLRAGPMRRRPPIALELAARTGGALRIETQDWVRRQLRALAEPPPSLRG
jgi:uncharacterized protein (TIGR02270 family)